MAIDFKLAPLRSAIGILEYWNDGILGYGKMVKWVIDIIHIDREVLDDYK